MGQAMELLGTMPNRDCPEMTNLSPFPTARVASIGSSRWYALTQSPGTHRLLPTLDFSANCKNGQKREMAATINFYVNVFPVCDLFEIKETESAGRGVFALKDIPKGTVLLETSTPAAWVIYDEYVKEVCAQCFAYDRGKAWKVRDSSKGIVFCSAECKIQWLNGIPEDQSVARDKIQKLLKKKRKTKDQNVEVDRHQPSLEDVDSHWDETERMAEEIKACRTTLEPTKKQRRTLQTVQDKFQEFQDPYLMWYMLEGLVNPISNPQNWMCLEQLVADASTYKEFGNMMRNTEAYLMLLAVVPGTLLAWVTQSAVRSLHAHSSHNVFGLRSLDEGGEEGDAGSECFGYGLWPHASYWNHSCAPNVQKKRTGRTWKFWANRDILKDEELCISYLGGDERNLDEIERKAKLKETWGFDCQCSKCAAGDLDMVSEKLESITDLLDEIVLLPGL